MAKRPSSSKDNDITQSKRPSDDEDDNPGVIEINSDPGKLIQNIQNILEYQKKAIPHLYPSKRKNKRSETIASLIQNSLTALDDRLEDAKKVKVTIATFGALGKGKSFILNHILKYGLKNHDLSLLPSGFGESKTRVPVKIKYGPNVEVIVKTSERTEVLLNKDYNETSIEKAATCIKDVFEDIDSYKDLECVDLVACLPVFQHLKEVVKRKCTYHDVEVEIEFVDLPGLGDSYGNALIRKELNLADIMLVFKNSASGRQVTIDDLKEVFLKRDVFDYANRPKFVIIENQSNPDCPIDEKSIKEKQNEEEARLAEEWRKLQELQDNDNDEDDKKKEERKKMRECYKMVYERLPLTTAKEFLEKFQEESKALVFSLELRSLFLSDLEEAIIEHVNKGILRKNIHPVVQGINKDANIRKKRISAVISKVKKTHQGKFKPLESQPFKLSLDSREDEDFFNKIESDIFALGLHADTDILKIHKGLVNMFKKLTVDHLLHKLRLSLKEHYETLVGMTERVNGLFISEQGLSHFARMSCETEVNKFMEEHARSLIDNCLKKLFDKTPSREVQKQWTESHDDKEQKKKLLEDHFNLLIPHLAELLSRGSRDDKLVTLRDTLLHCINEIVRLGFKNEGVDDPNNDVTLNNIKKSNLEVTKFSLKMIRELNPHFEHKKEFVDSKDDFPAQFLTFEGHEANVLPPINHTSRLNKVFALLSKNKKGALDELRRMLGFKVGSITVPDDCDEFQWTRILLKVLQSDPDFHHMTLDDSLHGSCKVELGTVPDNYLKIAKQQLFAYQRSKTTCDIELDQSIPNDTIRINVNEAQNGLTAFVCPALHVDLKKLKSHEPMKQLAPVFIPSIHYGPNIEELGNLFLEEDPWTAREEDGEDDNDDDTADQEPNTVDHQQTGLEELPVTIFCVVEPGHEDKFRSTLAKKPPNSNISFRYVVLPQNGRGIGVSRSIIKLLAESLKLPLYWTVDDDIKLIREYNNNSGYWKRSTIGRALLYGQHVYEDCKNRVVNDIPERQRYKYAKALLKVFPDWAEESETVLVAERLMNDSRSHDIIKNNIFCLNDQFPDEMIEKDCDGDPCKEKQLREALEKYIETFKEYLLHGNYKRIGMVSIGHESGRKNGYYLRSDKHYRKSMQNYQMVLYNQEALEGFNYVTDEVILQHKEGTVHQEDQRDVRYLGLKWEDKSFCRALKFYGIIGYQVITVALANQKLRNAFGRIGNSYQPEPLQGDDDDITHADEE